MRCKEKIIIFAPLYFDDKKVAKFNLYKIPLKSLSPGVHNYEYELDKKFFDAIDGDEIKKGNVQVALAVKKTSSTYEFNFHLRGAVQIPCNRCLDEMNQEIDTQNRLIVKLGKEYSEESEEIIIIPEDEGEINIAWFLYEFIVLDIPIKHVHPQGECNRAMSSKLRKHRAVSADDDDDIVDDDDTDMDSFSDSDDTPVSDPRWDALKGLNLDDN